MAIGLATAAFADRGGVYAGEGVLIGQPVCGSGPTIVESQPVVIEAAAQALPESAEPAAPEVDEPSRADALPRLEVGLAFELPANGLGVDAGRVAVAIGPVIVECPVMAWDAEGLTATVPAMTLATPTRAELIVSLADGSLAAAMPVHLVPAAETE